MARIASTLAGVALWVTLAAPSLADMQVQYRTASAAVAKPITAPALSPADSARGLVDFVVALDSEQSGRVFNHAGAEIPW